MWRAQPLTGISGPWADRMRQTWQQLYLDAVIAWSDAEIRIGNAGTIIDRLADLAAVHPLVEPLALALMKALWTAGRGAEAMDFYATTRHRLAEDLGIDPGPDLKSLYQTILRGDTVPVAVPSPGTEVELRLPGHVRRVERRSAPRAAVSRLRRAWPPPRWRGRPVSASGWGVGSRRA
jgi:DNA-binding SARP family transcriptional activator